MNNNSIERDIRHTVRDASELDNGAERAAGNLMNDVKDAREKYAQNPEAFSKYVHGVTTALTAQGLIPELALGYGKNNFENLDVDEKDGISKVELFMANERADNFLEKQLTGKLLEGFGEVRSAHESNKFVPFAKDANGITEDDLDAKIKEATGLRDGIHDHREEAREQNFLVSVAGDLTANGGRFFNKLARGDRDGDRATIDKDDLKSILGRDDKAKEHGSSELSARERKVTEYLLNNWDNEQVMFLRSDIRSFDSDGNVFVHEGFGDLTSKSANRAVTFLNEHGAKIGESGVQREEVSSQRKAEAAPAKSIPAPQKESVASQKPAEIVSPQQTAKVSSPPIVTEPCPTKEVQSSVSPAQERQAPIPENVQGQMRQPTIENNVYIQPPARVAPDYGYRQGQTPYGYEREMHPSAYEDARARPITPRPVGYERQIDRSSQFYSGGGMTLGQENYSARESSGRGVGSTYSEMPPPSSNGVTTFLNGLSQLNSLAAPWLVWDAQKQANRHGINTYSHGNAYSRPNYNQYRRGW